MKRLRRRGRGRRGAGFPRHRAAASLKRRRHQNPASRIAPEFSAASGRGLIEAAIRRAAAVLSVRRFPRHRAAASLKLYPRRRSGQRGRGFPRHRAAASLKPPGPSSNRSLLIEFSAASGRGLIEAASSCRHRDPRRPFSAASGRGLIEASGSPPPSSRPRSFSAASGRGLIEARGRGGAPAAAEAEFSAASGRGLIEAYPARQWHATGYDVFRGIGPRPH